MGLTHFPDGINAGDADGASAAFQIGGTAVTANNVVNALAYQSSGKEAAVGTIVVPSGGDGTAFTVSGVSRSTTCSPPPTGISSERERASLASSPHSPAAQSRFVASARPVLPRLRTVRQRIS